MFKNLHFLDIAEYVCLLTFVLGLFVAIFFQPFIYASGFFLFAALLLNVINRYRLFQVSWRRLQARELNRLHRQIADEMEVLRQELRSPMVGSGELPAAGDMVTTPRPGVSGDPSPDLSRLRTEVAELQQQSAGLLESISNIIDYLNKNSLLPRVEQLEKAVDSGINQGGPRLKFDNPAEYSPAPTTDGVMKNVEPVVPSTAKPPVLPRLSPEPEPQNWLCMHTLTDHTDWVRSLAVTTSGGSLLLVTGSLDTTINLCHLESGEVQQTLREHERGVLAVAISPDGKTLVSAGWDKTLKLWRLPAGEPLQTLTSHGGSVRALAITPDGKTIVSGSFDETIKLWKLETGDLIATLTDYASPVYALAITPDGKTLASGRGDGTLVLWHLEAPYTRILNLSGSLDVVESLAISPDGHCLLGGNGDGTIHLWFLRAAGENSPDSQPLFTIPAHSGPVTAVAVSPDSQTFTSGSADGTLKVWHFAGSWRGIPPKLVATLTEPFGAVMSVAYSPDGQKLISGSASGTARIWQLQK